MTTRSWFETVGRLEHGQLRAVRIEGTCSEPYTPGHVQDPPDLPDDENPHLRVRDSEFVLQLEADGRTSMQSPPGRWRVFPQHRYDCAYNDSWVWMPVVRGRGLDYPNVGWLTGSPDQWGMTEPAVDRQRFSHFADEDAIGEPAVVASRPCVRYALRHSQNAEDLWNSDAYHLDPGPQEFEVWVDDELPLMLRVVRDGHVLATVDRLTLDPDPFPAGPVEVTRLPISNWDEIPALHPVPDHIRDELRQIAPGSSIQRVVALTDDLTRYQATISHPAWLDDFVVSKALYANEENLRRLVPYRVVRDQLNDITWTMMGPYVNDPPISDLLDAWFART
jgi:hypothetical protein